MPPQPRKPLAQVLADSLNFFMRPYWSNVTLGRAANVSEGTIRNYRKDAATTGTSGKTRSAKLAELEAIAAAMGLQVSDLLQDLTDEQRAELYLQRAAEHYRRTGALPPWAPGARTSEASSTLMTSNKEADEPALKPDERVTDISRASGGVRRTSRLPNWKTNKAPRPPKEVK